MCLLIITSCISLQLFCSIKGFQKFETFFEVRLFSSLFVLLFLSWNGIYIRSVIDNIVWNIWQRTHHCLDAMLLYPICWQQRYYCLALNYQHAFNDGIYVSTAFHLLKLKCFCLKKYFQKFYCKFWKCSLNFDRNKLSFIFLGKLMKCEMETLFFKWCQYLSRFLNRFVTLMTRQTKSRDMSCQAI